MVEINSSATLPARTHHLLDLVERLGLRGASIEGLFDWIDSRLKLIDQQMHIADSVARGGWSRASAVDEMGDPFDSTSAGIFDSIVQTLEDSTIKNELHAGLAELRRAVTESAISGTV